MSPARATPHALRQARSFRVRAGRWRIAGRVLGREGAPPVVLVHGLGMSGLYLLPTALCLADSFEVWLPDLPGFGGSPPPEGTPGVEGLGRALAGFLEVIGRGPVALLGNSLGCQVIVDLAARRPELASRLVLAGPTIQPARRSARDQVVRLARDLPREARSLVALGAVDYLRAGPLRFWRTFRAALRDPIEEKAARVPHPTLVVRGGRDPVVPRPWAERLARTFPQGAFAEVPGAPHALNYSAAEALVRVAGPFIGGEPLPEASERLAGGLRQ
jgi:pimeloyl-ACP methyl ester carboxylesterase